MFVIIIRKYHNYESFIFSLCFFCIRLIWIVNLFVSHNIHHVKLICLKIQSFYATMLDKTYFHTDDIRWNSWNSMCVKLSKSSSFMTLNQQSILCRFQSEFVSQRLSILQTAFNFCCTLSISHLSFFFCWWILWFNIKIQTSCETL